MAHITRIPLILVVLTTMVTGLDGQTAATTQIVQRLEKKTLYLRGFPDLDQVTYNDQGLPEQEFKTGSWTYGQIYIEKVAFSEAAIEISGKRVGQEFDGQWKTKKTDEKQSLTIKVDSSALTPEVASKILDTVFILDERRIAKRFPDQWVKTDQFGTPVVPDKTKVRRIGGSVKPPVAIENPDSEPQEAAGKVGFKGTTVLWLVVDERGEVVVITVRRPLGMGLDEKAMEAVRRWRFKPATQNGLPVAVAFNLEVNFNLH